eukprot:CAMPEP_0115266272 /NCGR_PEP_ID=MMETSP0270-20121206/51381_1 /TAXON_ID=71861 /ORGANISM="Scrippsiella trochoidea, Strain CCMP3099" /LENGTH=46 /DNA_ID= /DNA_START= /DNA_END= /DNA_ORIENTATION=
MAASQALDVTLDVRVQDTRSLFIGIELVSVYSELSAACILLTPVAG